MKVAIIHYWLVGMRGGERVIEEFCRLFPDADIFTHVAIPQNLSDTLNQHTIRETFVGRMPGAKKHYQKYLAFMPRALEELDLSAYDLVISSESGPAKGVIVRPDAFHVCYTHTPMRYIWDLYPEYSAGLGAGQRRVFSHLAHRLRQWDVASAQRVDRFIANSSFVAKRIEKYWRRQSTVIAPPVDLSLYAPGTGGPGDYYLFVSELVSYKRADLAVEALSELDRPLKVVGSGAEAERIKALAGPNVEFLGRVPTEDLPDLYRGGRALIFPAMEDFGIVPVEAMACGRPVIAYGRGGALDSIKPGVTGVFFTEQTSAGLQEAVRRFETEFEPTADGQTIAAHAATFGADAFRAAIAAFISEGAPHLAVEISTR